MPTPSYRIEKSVVLVGLMGAGKTAIGTALARKIDCAFLDSDHEIERAANMPISEIFERYDEPFFRARETEVLERLLTGSPAILSTGGGAFLAEGNRDLIARHGVSLWLKADLDLLWSRVRHRDTRPLLKTADPYATLKALYEARTPIYQLASLSVQSRPEYSVEDMTKVVFDALIAAGHLREIA